MKKFDDYCVKDSDFEKRDEIVNKHINQFYSKNNEFLDKKMETTKFFENCDSEDLVLNALYNLSLLSEEVLNLEDKKYLNKELTALVLELSLRLKEADEQISVYENYEGEE
jgi:hypothetical protein